MARLDKELKDSASVESWLGVENFARLLQYCHVEGEAELAPIWSTLARAPAKDRLTIFEGKVTNEFLALGAIYEQFTPSLFLLTQITSLKWGMLNPDALDTGSLGNAFLFTDSTWRSHKAFLGLHTRVSPASMGSTPSGAPASQAPSVGGTSVSGLTLLSSGATNTGTPA